MDKITISNLSKFTCMNNHAVVKSLSESLDNFTRKHKLELTVILNDTHRKRQRSVGQIVSLCSNPHYAYGSGEFDLDKNELLNNYVIYDTFSQLYKIEVTEDPESEYYLIRVPDIIALLPKEDLD